VDKSSDFLALQLSGRKWREMRIILLGFIFKKRFIEEMFSALTRLFVRLGFHLLGARLAGIFFPFIRF